MTFDAIEKMQADTLNQFNRSGQARGTIDPDKLIAAAERIQKMIEEENKNRGVRKQQLEDTGAQLNAAQERLLQQIEIHERRQAANLNAAINSPRTGLQQDTPAPAQAVFARKKFAAADLF